MVKQRQKDFWLWVDSCPEEVEFDLDKNSIIFPKVDLEELCDKETKQ